MELTSADFMTPGPGPQEPAVIRKRARDSDDDEPQIPVYQQQAPDVAPQQLCELPMQSISSLQSFYPNTSSSSDFVLPTHAQDLGRLPVHPAPMVSSSSTSTLSSTPNAPLPETPQLAMDFQQYTQTYGLQNTAESQFSSPASAYPPANYYGQPSPIQPPVPVDVPGIASSSANPALDQDTLSAWSSGPNGFG